MLLVIAPRFGVGGGPSNTLAYLKYVPLKSVILYALRPHTSDELREFGAPILIYSPNLSSLNHYSISRLIRNILRKYSFQFVITLAPEYMVLADQKFLDKTIAVPQGFPEPSIIARFERGLLPKTSYWVSFAESIQMLNKVGAVGAISRYMYDRLCKVSRPRRIALIYNPVREFFFSYNCIRRIEEQVKSRKIRLIYVGRLVPLKGVDKLIEFFPYVLRELRDVELDIVGDGPLRLVLERLVKRSGLGKYVHIRGRVSDEVLAKLYFSSTVFVTASYWESFCIPVAEAAVLGVPSVVRAVYALKEHVELGYAVGFEKDYPEEFVKALGRVLDNYERMSIRGCEIARKLYHPAVVAKRVVEVLEKL